MKRKLPSPLSILMVVILIGALATWLIPAGKYDTLEYADDKFTIHSSSGDSVIPATTAAIEALGIQISLDKFKEGAIRKPVSIPGTYKKVEGDRQGFIEILQAPIKGIYEAIDIIFFVLIIGAFMSIFNNSGAMVAGLKSLSVKMKGRESWLIVTFTFLFSFGGSSFGMAEEGLVFYPILVPLFLAAGYDLLLPVAVIFAGTQLGTLSSFSNPFSTIIASDAAGVRWTEGLNERVVMFVLTTVVSIWYFVRYANRIKSDPSRSIVLRVDGVVSPPYKVVDTDANVSLDTKNKLLLLIFGATFLIMIAGVIFRDWWLTEMTTLFLASSILLGIVTRMKERLFIKQFIEGAQDLLGVGLIIGVARGVTIILNDGKISDSIVYYSAQLAGSMPPVLFILLLFMLYMVFSLFISSSSGMAVLTMPIMGSLAVLVNVPGREIVNAYLFGMGIMGFIAPTGLILPSLALVNVSLKAWWKFIYPLMLILFIICALCLAIGIYL